MGANCSCLSNHIFYSDIKIGEYSANTNHIIINNRILISIPKLIRIQSTFRGHLLRKKIHNKDKPLLIKSSTKSYPLMKKNTKISHEQIKILLKNILLLTTVLRSFSSSFDFQISLNITENGTEKQKNVMVEVLKFGLITQCTSDNGRKTKLTEKEK